MNETSYGDYERRHNEGGFHVLNRLLIFVIIVALCVAGVIASVPIFKQYREQNAQISELQQKLALEKALLARRIREEQLLKNDPAYLEIVSRDRLDVMKSGETIIHLDPPHTAGKPAASKN